MKPHTRIYMKHFGYQIAEDVHCELCNAMAVDIHHIYGRGKGKDVIANLIALCRSCHDLAHSIVSKETIQHYHNKKLNNVW